MIVMAILTVRSIGRSQPTIDGVYHIVAEGGSSRQHCQLASLGRRFQRPHE